MDPDKKDNTPPIKIDFIIHNHLQLCIFSHKNKVHISFFPFTNHHLIFYEVAALGWGTDISGIALIVNITMCIFSNNTVKNVEKI